MKYKHFLLITFATVALTTLSCVECSETHLRVSSNSGLQLLEKATALAESKSQDLQVSHRVIRVLVGRIQEYKKKSSPGQVALDSDGASGSPDGLSSQEAMLAMCATPCVPPVNVEVQTDPDSKDAGPLSELNAQNIMQLQAEVSAHATTIAARDAAIDRHNIQVQKSADLIRKIARQRKELKCVNHEIVLQNNNSLEHVNSLQAELASHNETIAAHVHECDELSPNVSAHAVKIGRLQPLANQVPGLEDDVARLNAEVTDHVATIATQDQQITDLQGDVNRLQGIAEQVPGLNANVARLNAEVLRLQGELAAAIRSVSSAKTKENIIPRL